MAWPAADSDHLASATFLIFRMSEAPRSGLFRRTKIASDILPERAAFLPVERPDQVEQRPEGLLDGHSILLAVVPLDDFLAMPLEIGAQRVPVQQAAEVSSKTMKFSTRSMRLHLPHTPFSTVSMSTTPGRSGPRLLDRSMPSSAPCGSPASRCLGPNRCQHAPHRVSGAQGPDGDARHYRTGSSGHEPRPRSRRRADTPPRTSHCATAVPRTLSPPSPLAVC